MVPDGTYTLQSKAFEATGASGYSTGVEVTIDNQCLVDTALTGCPSPAVSRTSFDW